MHRPALARLYRPKRFSEIVGQDHVSATLKTAIERGRVAHAYLFCGPRGIGKTTAARVLAMSLNCENREDGEPCGRCESCERIWAGRTSLDVVEIDAASNRGVDDARDLRERAMYAPSEESRYKVYIIDEAHMLTREAWNAFLKIFEEPPPRVIFVLATTEPAKIFQSAPPILSRCQRFDFRRISTDQIRERLGEVMEAEKVEADEAALLPIARKADGALRDALSALDQVLAFSGDRITATDVRQVLGLVEEDLYFELLDIILERRAADVFEYVERLSQGGYDLEEFYKGLAEALRSLLRIRLQNTESLDSLSPAFSERYVDFSRRFAPGDLLRMLSALAELDTDGRFRKSEQQRILIEVLLLKFAMLDKTVQLEEVIGALGQGESSPTGAPTSGPGPSESESRSAGQRAKRQPGRSNDAGPPEAGRSREPGQLDAPSGPPVPESGPATGGSTPLDKARAAWREVLAEGRALRPGQGIALRAAQIVDLSESGDLRIAAPKGTPGAEVLDDGVARRRLEQELARRLGGAVQIVTGGDADPPLPRVTAEAAREQRLARLVEEDRELKQLVDELDLEVME